MKIKIGKEKAVDSVWAYRLDPEFIGLHLGRKNFFLGNKDFFFYRCILGARLYVLYACASVCLRDCVCVCDDEIDNKY